MAKNIDLKHKNQTVNQSKNTYNKTIRRIFVLMAKHRLRLAFSIVLAVAVVLSTLLVPVLTGRAVDSIVAEGKVDFIKLRSILIYIVILLFVCAVSRYIMDIINNLIAYEMLKDIRIKAFEKLQSLPVSFIDSTTHGSIINRLINDVNRLSEGLLLGFTQFFTGVLTIILTLILIFRVSFIIGAVVVGLTPLSMLAAFFIAKKTHTYFKNQSVCQADMAGVVDEMTEGISCVKAFNTEAMVCEEFKAADERLRQASLKAIFFQSITNPSTRFINSSIYALVGIVGAFSVIRGSISVGELAAVLSYAVQYAKPFNEISAVFAELQNSVICASRVFSLIDEPEILPDKKTALELTGARGEVELKNIAFSYNKDRGFIKNLNIKAESGQRIAIVGPTGCGKTTLINLLMRFYEIESGNIFIDKMNIQDIKRNSLVGSYGMVLQDTWLKSGTIKENIAMGRPEAGIEEIRKAAREAYADSFISKLPQGYDTVIGHDGGSLSSGQKQLLCIARVMLSLPSMLILDEATSSLDTMTEMRIKEAFDKMMAGRTSFVVAHRLSTITGADVILVMKDGAIIERGRHQELLAMKGFYSELYSSQYSNTAD